MIVLDVDGEDVEDETTVVGADDFEPDLLLFAFESEEEHEEESELEQVNPQTCSEIFSTKRISENPSTDLVEHKSRMTCSMKREEHWNSIFSEG